MSHQPVDPSVHHQEYVAASAMWRRCRDCAAGADAIKAAGQQYLPALIGQSPQEYANYLRRAVFNGVTGRTTDGLLGAIMRKPPTVSVPDAMTPMLTNIDGRSMTLTAFAARLVREVLTVGRVGVLVDMPVASDNPSNPMPYLVSIVAEDIINWRIERINGEERLVLLVIREIAERTDPYNPFVTRADDQYRVFQLVDGRCQMTLWGKGQGSWTPSDPIVPVRRGQPLPFIPFQFIGPTSTQPGVEKSPINDLAVINIHQYMGSADLEHGRHFTALPTPVIIGLRRKQDGVSHDPIRIGSSTALILENENADAKFMEFTGHGLRELREGLEEKQRMMAALGTRLIEHSPAVAETATAVRLRHGADSSTLTMIASTVSQALEQSLRWSAWWHGDSNDPNDPRIVVALNTDFFPAGLSPEEMRSLMMLWQAGGISFDTLFHNLQVGEKTRPGVTAAIERHDISSDDDSNSDDITEGHD